MTFPSIPSLFLGSFQIFVAPCARRNNQDQEMCDESIFLQPQQRTPRTGLFIQCKVSHFKRFNQAGRKEAFQTSTCRDDEVVVGIVFIGSSWPSITVLCDGSCCQFCPPLKERSRRRRPKVWKIPTPLSLSRSVDEHGLNFAGHKWTVNESALISSGNRGAAFDEAYTVVVGWNFWQISDPDT